MIKAMIRRIEKINDYRIFQRWKQSSNAQFARVNLIYGQNGSGKSTLADLMLGCAVYAADHSGQRDTRHAEVVRSGVRLKVETDGTERDVDLNDAGFWVRLRVFNKRFVHQNLSFGDEKGPHPQALLTIGKTSVDAEAQLAELRPKLDEIQSKIGSAEEAAKSADSAAGKRLTQVARAVTDALLGTQASEYNPRSYKKNSVEKLLNAFDSDQTLFDDASTDLAVDRKTATSGAMARVHLPYRQEVLGRDAVADARALLDADVVNEAIDALQGHPDRSEWVQDGIDLHKGLDECLFCGQPLTADRCAELNAHFDDSFTRLQGDIDALVGRLEASVTASKTYLDSLPADTSVYEDLKVDLQRARATYKEEHEAYSQAVECIVAALKQKRNNPFDIASLGLDVTLKVPDTAGVKKVVAEHAEKISKHDEEARSAARRVELYHVKQFADEYKRLKKDAEDKKSVAEALAKKAGELRDQIASLENVGGDPVPGAEELTNNVARLLGRVELRFSTALDGKHYVIERNGAPATNLSEGEQTAIALLYFLVSVREDKIEGDPPIVVIDDPVSSLDNSILYGASASIWSELVAKTKVSQVFLMTHNFELFRQWLVQMESVPKNVRDEEGGYTAYEMRATCEADDRRVTGRIPRLVPWPLNDKKMQKLRSQYHFLFSRVADGLLTADSGLGLAEQMEIMALLPNAARRMMESFLSFHRPDKMGSFHGSMRAVPEDRPGLDDSVRTHVERYLHAYSHLEEADISRSLDLGESMAVLRSLFRFMYHVDRNHVSSMCTALGIKEQALLGESVSALQKGPIS